MSRVVASGLLEALRGDALSLALIWKVTRTDGQSFYFTDHSEDLVYDGATYRADAGVLASPLQQDRSMGVDNMEVMSIFLSSRITSDDIQAGLYDDATVEIRIVDFEDLTSSIVLAQGWRLGQIEIRDNALTAELRGIAQRLRQEIVWLYQPKCRAILGDSRCGIDLDDPSFYVDASVEDNSGTTRALFFADLQTTSADPDAYRYGKVAWTSGANTGLSMEIASYDPDTHEVTLFLEMPYDIEYGDGFRATMGCDKDIATCVARFDNVLNFRGEPHVPDGKKIGVAIAEENVGGRFWGK